MVCHWVRFSSTYYTLCINNFFYFSHDGGRVYPTHTRDHTAWRGTRRARRPRAHGSAEAFPAQHYCTLRARNLMHSSLDAVQCGVANANHHCSSTANICTTTPPMHTCGGTCRASASTLPTNHRAIHCRRRDLAALLLALLHAHLTALQFLQLAAQRHSQATFPARQDLGKRVRARIPLRHRAPFDTCKADTAGQSHHPQHHPQAAPIRRPSPPIPAASAHGTFELTTSLRMTRARDSELEYLAF